MSSSSTTSTSSNAPAPSAVQVHPPPHPSLETNDPSVQAVWKSKKHVIFQEEQFNHHLSNTLYNAWRHFTYENYLYGVYGLVAFLTSEVTEYQYPNATLVSTPQALFYPPRVDELGERTSTGAASDARDPSAQTAPDEAGALGTESAAPSELPDPANCDPATSSSDPATSNSDPATSNSDPASNAEATQQDEKKIPDFARIIVFNRAPFAPEDIASRDDIFVDFWEIKRLAIREQWHSPEARDKAKKQVEHCMTQVYNTAMEAFKCNPSWNRVTALLIIGCYFSQFEWIRQQAESSTPIEQDESGRPPVTPGPNRPPVTPVPNRPPVTPVPNRPPVTPMPIPPPPPPMTPLDVDPSLASDISLKNMKDLTASQEERLAELERRSPPTVYYFNELAFVMERDEAYGMRCSLSPVFIEALARPLHVADLAQNDVTIQPSWLDIAFENRKPNVDAQHLVARFLRDTQIEETEALIDSLKGVKKPEHAKSRIPATPQTDPKDTNYPAQARRRARDETPTPSMPKLDAVGQRPKRVPTARGDTPNPNEGSSKLREDRRKQKENEMKEKKEKEKKKKRNRFEGIQ